MHLLTQREFSLLAACSDAAVSKAMTAGRLERASHDDGSTGIDPTSSSSRLFIESVAAQKIADLAAGGTGRNRGGRPRSATPPTQAPRKTPRPADPSAAPSPIPAAERAAIVPTAPRVTARGSTGLDRVEARDDEIALKVEILRTKVGRDKKADWRDDRRTASTALVRAVFGEVEGALGENFRTLPDRTADELEAMGAAGAPRAKFADFLSSEIDQAMKAMVKQLKISTVKICAEADDGLS
jgi:hypothetical protein